MFCQADFGARIKELRRVKGLSQREAALQMGVSEQAISKWESGACLPDVYHLKLLGKVLGVSVDCLLDVEREQPEKVLETFQAGGAVFELVEKPETILAGKLLYAKDFGSIQEFDSAIEAFSEAGRIRAACGQCASGAGYSAERQFLAGEKNSRVWVHAGGHVGTAAGGSGRLSNAGFSVFKSLYRSACRAAAFQGAL